MFGHGGQSPFGTLHVPIVPIVSLSLLQTRFSMPPLRLVTLSLGVPAYIHISPPVPVAGLFVRSEARCSEGILLETPLVA
jgi:hypothetical protein